MRQLLYFLSLILGIILLRVNLIAYSISLFVLIVFLILRQKQRIKQMLRVLLIISFGILSINIPSFLRKDDYLDNKIVVVTKAKENYVLVSNLIEKFYIYSKSNEYDEGDFLRVSGRTSNIDFNVIESQFDFNEYLKNYGVYKQIYVKEVTIVFDYPFSKKKYFINHIEKYNKDAKFLLISNFMGIKDYNYSNFLYYKTSNLLVVLANSGFLFGFVINSLMLILSVRFNKKKASILTILLTLPFLLFNIFTYSIFRIYLVFVINFFLKHIFKKKIERLSIISSFGFISLIINPYFVFRSDFVFVNLASLLSIDISIVAHNKNETFVSKIRMFIKRKTLFYLLFLPLSISSTHSFNIASFVSQILLMPCFKINYLLAFFSFYLGFNPLINYTSAFLNYSVRTMCVEELNIHIPPLSINTLLMYYIIYILFILFCQISLFRITKRIKKLSFILFVIYCLPIKNLYTVSVSFINVGQGDSILIRNRYDSYLIDTGGLKNLDVANDSLMPFLRSNRIYSLNAVFITHDDFDHSGALDSLVQNFRVNNIISTKEAFPFIHNSLKFVNLNTYEFNESNDSSLVISLFIKGKSFLFMGDATKEVEKRIIIDNKNLNVDYLKVGHHGSNTSTSEEFIKSIKPKEAIISCGKNNIYNHPSDETIRILRKYNVRIRRTDYEGTITYVL